MSRYDELMEEYLAELSKAREKALKWWDTLVERETVLKGSRSEALQSLKMRWQVGPVSHPYVIAVYRAFYLRVVEMNQKVEEEEEGTSAETEAEASWGVEDEDENEEEGTVEPEYLLRQDLNHWNEELYEFMQPLVFSPIGLDPDENYA